LSYYIKPKTLVYIHIMIIVMLNFWVGGIGGDCNGLDFGFTPEAAASPPPPATPNSGNGKYSLHEMS
jgi:hypothetical protein